ncbi:MAG: putative Na+/H+ antiporter, partial [Verrucomicrobiae bacterium]
MLRRSPVSYAPRLVRWLPALLMAGFAACAFAAEPSFPTSLESYADPARPGVLAKLAGRVAQDPFNLVATAIFLAAIVHTFLVAKFRIIAHRLDHEYETLGRRVENGDASLTGERDKKKFFSVVFHFLGEVEVVFGIWLIPLAAAIILMKGPGVAKSYINGVNFTEPIFVVVVMAIAGSRPVLFFAEKCLGKVARLGGATPAAWWLAILTAGPLLGSFVTEPAAMTICALLLVSKFFRFQPSLSLRYATLGLL